MRLLQHGCVRVIGLMCFKSQEREAANVLSLELENWYSITLLVLHTVTELPQFKGRKYKPYFSIEGVSKTLWSSLLCYSIKEKTGEQNACKTTHKVTRHLVFPGLRDFLELLGLKRGLSQANTVGWSPYLLSSFLTRHDLDRYSGFFPSLHCSIFLQEMYVQVGCGSRRQPRIQLSEVEIGNIDIFT